LTFGASSIGAKGGGFEQKVKRLHWGIITVLCALAAFGVIMHLSAAEGLWADRPLSHGVRFLIVLAITLALALVLDIRAWLALAYPLYALALGLLVVVEVAGATRMGATRWLDLGPIQLQPSEIMKIAIILALARYYQHLDSRHAGSWWTLIPPLLMVGAPVALVMKQPDLGTSLLILGTGVGVMFLAGLQWRYIAPALVAGVGGAFYAFNFVLHDYQRQRILTFLDPEADPLGAGYHVAQSKIAIGSAGVFGRGYQQGSQSQGDFLPEKHTDFIFTMIVEEFGLVGAFLVLALFSGLLIFTMMVALRARNLFAKLAVGGVGVTTALYVLINTSMVIGLIPVVGIPLPLLSFGGTAMVTIMMGMAIVLSAHINREDAVSSRGILL
jgi:rod shape determining protein RodA